MIRFILLLVLFGSLDLYLSKSVLTVIEYWTQHGHEWTTIFEFIHWAMLPLFGACLFILLFSTETMRKNSFVFYVFAFLSILYISKFIALPIFLVDSIANLVGPNEIRSVRISHVGLLLSLIPTILLFYGVLRNPYRYEVRTTKLVLPNLPSELHQFRIVQISDFHAGSLNVSRVQNGIDSINSLKPDLFVFTGDLVNNSADEVEPFVKLLSTIQARYGKFSILGNHDYGDYVRWKNMEAKQANLQKLIELHEQIGWRLLLDEAEQIAINGKDVMTVYGVQNISGKGRFSSYGNLAKALAGKPTCPFNVLLSHDPSHWDAEVKGQVPIELTLSGHTHGGQFGLELFGKQWSPVQYFYKQWAGLYENVGQFLYVSRGFGFIGYPGRVGILPEITLIELNKA